jgi:hypothetical protein
MDVLESLKSKKGGGKAVKKSKVPKDSGSKKQEKVKLVPKQPKAKEDKKERKEKGKKNKAASPTNLPSSASPSTLPSTNPTYAPSIACHDFQGKRCLMVTASQECISKYVFDLSCEFVQVFAHYSSPLEVESEHGAIALH